MRISGNYFDRLLFNILPYTVIAFIIIHFAKTNDFKLTVTGFLLTTATFWLIDTLIVFFKFKRPKALKLDTAMSWGNREILPEEIFRIRPITDSRFRMSVNMIEVSLTDGTTFYLIDKPKTFIADILGKPSKTLSRLKEKYPELDEKITGQHFI